jgi:AcrR family transcriptional regulator
VAHDTRDRILAVASELFTEQGYDGTSLREIAERLDVTKAALYYHFQSKDEILAELLAPADVLLTELLTRLEAAVDVEGWADALGWVIDHMVDYLDLFKLVDRNRRSSELVIETFESMVNHQEMHERVERAADAAARDVPEQIRMITALGAVTGFDDWAPRLLARTAPEVIQRELTAVTRDILHLHARRGRRRTTS